MRQSSRSLQMPSHSYAAGAATSTQMTLTSATHWYLPRVDSEPRPPQLVNELPNTREENNVRLPRAVQALYLQPLRREAEYGVPSCDLQLRSYSIPNLEFFCDFALRAAYYLDLPAFGPVPLPKITERWTVPRSSFIFKKSQENFERITRRRLIQIRDGHPETVQIWLAYLQKHAYYGIGMKANMWEYGKLDTGKQMDAEMSSMRETIEAKMEHLGSIQIPIVVNLSGGAGDGATTVIYYQMSAVTASAWCGRLSVNAARRLGHSRSQIRSRFQQRQQRRHNSDAAVIFSGIQPTGVPHLGNYLGALRQWKRLQDIAPHKTKLLFSVVDLHAITMPQDGPVLMQRKREMLAAMIAIGLDPQKSTLFYQSSVPEHTELMWILSCTASMGYLGRMTQWKSKLQMNNKAQEFDETVAPKLKLGLFSYPVLQAADVLVHRATHVPVGDDQRQHLEFARECATNFNTPSPRVMSLVNPLNKMSKSTPNHRSRILITASPDEIRQRIMGAVTDSLNAVTYEPFARPGVANLLEILSQCSPGNPTPTALASELTGAGLGDLKKQVTAAVTSELAGIRDRYEEVLGSKGGKYLDEIQAACAEKARLSAAETMRIVRDVVGLRLGDPTQAACDS
ncbi:hypothetical protein DL766_004084 [Monosporascus sp. MC13-8B]|uniref:tryptophan--tRNA ligase n=1 Tax=Monosporascus cannonballus TaxID=155416 RepID=A0ABY0H6P8_9PEZI|nr:hypothetical protein DL762_006313 [Monosporascus cannonballus]RYO87073.1 hypothetical protein DL763_006494 [Monosporascus cannonballus]RYP32163.1 hypothetical protein DL766_004084 [Monosporascus sp. MC13-8B]